MAYTGESTVSGFDNIFDDIIKMFEDRKRLLSLEPHSKKNKADIEFCNNEIARYQRNKAKQKMLTDQSKGASLTGTNTTFKSFCEEPIEMAYNKAKTNNNVKGAAIKFGVAGLGLQVLSAVGGGSVLSGGATVLSGIGSALASAFAFAPWVMMAGVAFAITKLGPKVLEYLKEKTNSSEFKEDLNNKIENVANKQSQENGPNQENKQSQENGPNQENKQSQENKQNQEEPEPSGKTKHYELLDESGKVKSGYEYVGVIPRVISFDYDVAFNKKGVVDFRLKENKKLLEKCSFNDGFKLLDEIIKENPMAIFSFSNAELKEFGSEKVGQLIKTAGKSIADELKNYPDATFKDKDGKECDFDAVRDAFKKITNRKEKIRDEENKKVEAEAKKKREIDEFGNQF